MRLLSDGNCGRFEYVPQGQECYLFSQDARYVKTFNNDANTVGGFPYCGDNCFEYGVRIKMQDISGKIDFLAVDSAEDCQACKIVLRL